ncbi:hypothetical protein ACFCVY_19320 [Streptomyces sp. NPDC056411]|uniref:hypothetical protein n=1 Tax=Streptomyces sp. NPDC056411 TaxID=3345813 RepID=UPI0035DE25E7
MRKSMDRPGHGVVCALASLTLSAALTSAVAAPIPRESARIPFAERFHVTQHGGIARAANSVVTCRRTGHHRAGRPTHHRHPAGQPTAGSCAPARRGGAGTDGRYRPVAVDVDSDLRTALSSQAELRIPAGSRISYARLYWGGSLRAGARGPVRDGRRVLVAGPGGRYRELTADTLTGHRTSSAGGSFQASADVTELVRRRGAGAYTVARTAAARARSGAGAWGGWTLVAVYENRRQPLRQLALWDGFERLGGGRRSLAVRLGELRIPAKGHGRVGVLAYGGHREREHNRLSVRADRHRPYALRDSANPVHDVMNSTITEFGRESSGKPAHPNTSGLDSDVFDVTPALRSGADRLIFRFTTHNPGYLLGALFVETDTRR